jgi:hypothetical protein
MVIGTDDSPPLSDARFITLGDEPRVEDEEVFTLTNAQYLSLPPSPHVILQLDDTPQPPAYWDCGMLPAP